MQVFYFLILLLVHPFYISTTEITLKEDKHDIKIKIFRDDLEDGLRLFFDKSISIDTELKLENRSSQVADYIKDKFQIRVNKSEIIPSIDNYNLVNDLVEIYLSFETRGDINNIKVYFAELTEGMLSIFLEKIITKDTFPIKIKINTKNK